MSEPGRDYWLMLRAIGIALFLVAFAALLLMNR